MDRVLLVGGAMLLVGLAMAGVWVVIYTSGDRFEIIEDTVVRWLGRA